MGRTAPAPNVPAPPGMAPGVAVKAGGGAGGGSGSGGAGSGGGGSGGGPGAGGDGAGGGAPSASEGSPDGKKGQGGCAHPIDVITGAMYTPPATDFTLGGPLGVQWIRCYRTSNLKRSCGIGVGWWHNYAWRARTTGKTLELIDGSGLATKLALPDDGADVVMAYGRTLARRGQLLLIGDSDGVQRTLAPHSCGYHLLADVRDRYGNAVAIEVDALGHVVGLRDDVGRRVVRKLEGQLQHWHAYASDGEGREHSRHLVSYEVDERGDLLRVIDPEHHAWAFRYDERHYMLTEQRPDRVRFQFVYERPRTAGHRRCIETWGESLDGDILALLGREEVAAVVPAEQRPRGIFHTRIEYGPEDNTSVITEGDGGTHSNFGNALGLIEKYVDPRGHVTTAEYDALGNATGYANGRGAPSKTATTPEGLIVEHTDERGNVTRVERNARRLATAIHDAAGGHWQLHYDDHDALIARRDPVGAVTSFEYDERGQLLRNVEPDGTVIERQHDAHGNVVSLKVGMATWHYQYDLFGSVVAIANPRGARWQIHADRRGYVVGVDGPHGQNMRYQRDGLGRPTEITHPSGGKTQIRYVADAVVERRFADSSRMRLGYDALLRGIWIENGAGEQHLVRRDPAGLPLWQRTFAGVESKLWHDADGRFTRAERHDGGVVEYVHDDFGQLVEVNYADGNNDTFEYDAVGRIISASTGNTEVRYELDPLGNVLREEQQAADWQFDVSHERDELGRITTSRYSTGWQEDYQYFGGQVHLRRQVSVGDAVVDTLEVERDAARADSSWRRPDTEQRVTTLRDELGRPLHTTLETPGGVVDERKYQWSEHGVVARVDHGQGCTRFELDQFGRVTAEQSSAEHGGENERRIAYSNHGTPCAEPVTLAANGRVAATDRANYDWDELGRLVAIRPNDGPAWTLHYDGRDRLIELQSSTGRRVRHTYDAFGRRLAREEDGAVTWFGWSGDAPVEEQAGDGEWTRRVYADDGYTLLLEGTRDDGWCMVASDAAATPWSWLARDGSHRGRTLDVFGNDVNDGGASRVRFAGQRADDAADLIYQRFRYYLPSLGQFITPDPMGITGSYQDVGFVTNPTAYIDPLGLIVVCMTDDPWGVQESQLRAQAHGQDWVHRSSLDSGAASLAGHGHVELATHGKPGAAQIGSGYYNGTTMGQMLKSYGYKGKSVNLIVCNGATPPSGGGNSFAQDIANETGANVTGANGALVYTNGAAGGGSLASQIIDPTTGKVTNTVKCGTWDTVGPQNQTAGSAPSPPINARVPPGMDPSQVRGG